MTHVSEATFASRVRQWFEGEHGYDAVNREVWQPQPRWYVDLVVNAPPCTLYVEIENDKGSIRDGVSQALGYAADDPHGVPMVVVPAGHTEPERVRRLQQSSRCLIRAFDAEADAWVGALATAD